MPEVAPIARHTPCRGQRPASPERSECTTCPQEYICADRGPARSHRVAQSVYRLIISYAADLPRLHHESKLVIQVALQLPCGAPQVALVLREEEHVIRVPQLVRHESLAGSPAGLVHRLDLVIAEAQDELRHPQAEEASYLKATVICRQKRLAQIDDVAALDVLPEDADDESARYARIALPDVQVNVIASLMRPPAHRMCSHELAFTLDA